MAPTATRRGGLYVMPMIIITGIHITGITIMAIIVITAITDIIVTTEDQSKLKAIS
jgi:hypothetical protein